MKLFLDCEFTNFNADLISMALVSGEVIGVNAKITMTWERRLEYTSSLPHNALEDARAIKTSYLKKYTI